MKLQKIATFLTKIKEKNAGFSLTEIMITMSIINTVSAVGTTQIDQVIPLARDANRKANTHQVQPALNLYYNDNLTYPVSSDSEPTVAEWNKMALILENVDNTYMPEVPLDPLNTDNYIYKYWSNGQKFKITYTTEDPNDKEIINVWGM
jgi:prepilin-type N-terminal cleavage/methylation domain-containing protein